MTKNIALPVKRAAFSNEVHRGWIWHNNVPERPQAHLHGCGMETGFWTARATLSPFWKIKSYGPSSIIMQYSTQPRDWAENTTLTYSRHNSMLIWRSRDMTGQSLLTLALRRHNWTHWTAIKQHGMGWFW